MNIDKLNQAFTRIVEKKLELSKLAAESAQRNAVSDELESLINDFMADYGTIIEEALFNVHDEYCPDCDVMRPLAYIASDYIRKNDRMIAPQGEGIPVYCDDYPDLDARLVFEPNPMRLVIQGANQSFREVVWQAS
jgi:hypothetical protein